MKKLFLTLISFIISISAFSQVCPKNWSASLYIEDKEHNSINMSLIFSGINYSQLKHTAGIDLVFSNQFHNYMSIKNDILFANFVEKKTNGLYGEKNKDIKLARITEKLDTDRGLCFKLKMNPSVSINEVITKTKGNCWPLGSFLCPKDKMAGIDLETTLNGQSYRYKSVTSVLISK